MPLVFSYTFNIVASSPILIFLVSINFSQPQQAHNQIAFPLDNPFKISDTKYIILVVYHKKNKQAKNLKFTKILMLLLCLEHF
jgi:hypothetical protein